MKKLLTILGAVGLMATTGATVVACGNDKKDPEVKGDFKLIGNTNVDVTQEITIEIDDYTNVSETWTNFQVVIETENGKTDLISYNEITNEGKLIIKGLKAGEVKLHFIADKVENPENFINDETTEPDGKSQTVTIKVSAQDMKKIIPEEKLVLGDSKTSEAKAKVEAILKEEGIALFDKVDIKDPIVNGEKGSVVVEAKKANNDTLIGTVTFTYKVLPEA